MKKLTLNLAYCYGINKLTQELSFENAKINAVYAPNGMMKTSFARTFKDISEGIESSDRVFPDRITIREVNDETGQPIGAQTVFVIEPYNEAYKSDKISTLLVNKDLRTEYEKIYKDINDKKEIFLKSLQKISGVKSGVDEIIAETITHDPKEFFIALSRIKQEVCDNLYKDFSEFSYSKVFNDKVLAVIESPDFRENLEKYIEKYNDLVSKSNFFKKGIFNHNNASDISKSLKSNGYFQAEHSIRIKLGNEFVEISNESELEAVIEKEKKAILENPELETFFEKIDKQLTKNQDLKNFRSYIEVNKHFLPELSNLERLKQKIWISYMSTQVDLYEDLLNIYDAGKGRILEIVNKAKSEATKWQHVLKIFNSRFSVPFRVRMENQEDVILKSDAPNVTFEFVEESADSPLVTRIKETDLLRVLSNGEKRALYLLNIIFEVEARKELHQETLFVIDDIADSFDYKNKYAIVEYLKDISEEDNFFQIILTHNFDFYRTVTSRLIPDREHQFHTVKTPEEILLIKEFYQNNPLHHWKKHLTNPEMLIASIPFVRNLAEFCGYSPQFIALTSLLHIKEDSYTAIVSDLENLIRQILKDVENINFDSMFKVQRVIDLIFSTAEGILAKSEDETNLEQKIVLSIAIRLRAEEYMIAKILDKNFCRSISKNQTVALTRQFKKDHPSLLREINLMEQVNLMTPESIHLNSFMYEPLVDLSNGHLKKLYTDIKAL